MAGIPLGMVRGRHTDVTLGDRPHTTYIKSSMVVLFVRLGAFGFKALLRYAALVTSYVMIWQKYQQLLKQQPA